MKSDTGIPNKNNEVVITFLNLLLADEYVLYTKTRTAHWNVDGASNFELHVFLENHFNALDEIIDKIAEQIRSLGHFALGSLKDFLSIAEMADENDNHLNSRQIIEMLLQDHESIISILQHEIFPISGKLKDHETANFLKEILEQQKTLAQLLRSFLSNPELNINNYFPIVQDKTFNHQQA